MSGFRLLLDTCPQKFRLCVLQAVGNRGYTALGEQILDPEKQTKGDTKEAYYICSALLYPFLNPKVLDELY